MINHIIILSLLHDKPHTIDRSWQFNIAFFGDHTCMIDHVVLLSAFRDRPHLYNQSRCGLVWSSSQTIPYQINHDNFVLFLAMNGLIRLVTSLSSLIYVIDYHYPISLDNLVSYSLEITPLRSIMLLSYLVFMLDRILSYWS